MKKKLWLLITLTVGITLWDSCSEDDPEKEEQHDPYTPVLVETLMPDSGGIRTKFIIKGSNFGSDISKIKVLFSDDEKSATIVGVDNQTIYGLVPKQSGGDNKVKVLVESDTITCVNTFHYTVVQAVSTITGVVGENSLTDGSLSVARFNYLYGVAAVAGGDIIVTEKNSGNVRFVAVNDNKVTTLQTNFYTVMPALTKDRKKVYCVGQKSPHKIYTYEKDNLWQPQLFVSSISGFSGEIWSAVLDKEEKWLYFLDTSGKFGRLEIASPSNVETLSNSIPMGSGDGTHNSLAYSAYDDCFFYTIYKNHIIYKLNKDGSYELWIGGNGQGIATGHRTETAQLYYPGGLTVDADGNIYWANIDGNTIEKCDRKSGYVSLIAGIPVTMGHLDGEPLDAKFHLPYGLSIDEDGNFIICECWGSGVIRKLAIE